jgi:type II secretory pathway pseudopilin PulG
MYMKQTPQANGFTIIELLLTVVITCILGALIVLTVSGVQAKNRNGQRQADIDSLRAQLESYYAGNDHYPTLENISNQGWRLKNMPKLKTAALRDPSWRSNIECTLGSQVTLAAFIAPGCYSYQVVAADGSLCDNDKIICVRYLLTANLEGGGTYTKSNLN